MGTKACHWAAVRVTEHEGVSVGMKAYQWAQRNASGHEGVHCMIGNTDVSSPPQAKKILEVLLQ